MEGFSAVWIVCTHCQVFTARTSSRDIISGQAVGMHAVQRSNSTVWTICTLLQPDCSHDKQHRDKFRVGLVGMHAV
jgi:hypothetical protein